MLPENISIGMKVKVKIHSSDLKYFHLEKGTIIFIHAPTHLLSERYDIQLVDGTILISVDPEFIEEIEEEQKNN